MMYTYITQGQIDKAYVERGREKYEIKPAVVVKVNGKWTYATPMQAQAFEHNKRSNGGWEMRYDYITQGQPRKAYVSRDGSEYEIREYSADTCFDAFNEASHAQRTRSAFVDFCD